MKRYHEEKHIFENRIKKYKDVNAGWRSCGAANNGLPYNPTKQDEVGRYRKTLRVGVAGGHAVWFAIRTSIQNVFQHEKNYKHV